MLAERPLCALFSQVLVAFTLEFDNEFERRMGAAGYPGTTLSMSLWDGLLCFLADGAKSVGNLAKDAGSESDRLKLQLGCLERWQFVTLEFDGKTARVRRDGWGSGRGIRSAWTVALTEKGRKACEVWAPLAGRMEQRWRTRFGETLAVLCERLAEIVGRQLPLPALLSQALLAFTQEFDSSSSAPLWLCASTIRVLDVNPTPAAEIPRLTGSSPETSGIGWQIKPYVIVESDPGAGGNSSAYRPAASAPNSATAISPRGLRRDGKTSSVERASKT